MNIKLIERSFAKMGSRFKLTRGTRRWTSGYSIDIRKDKQGEFFDLSVPETMNEQLELTVMQNVPEDQHLLLLVRNNDSGSSDRFLCGHDERDWFVAAVPGTPSSVRDAKEMLKPALVLAEQARLGVSTRQKNRRKNRAFRRQGEWFFIKAAGLEVDPALILYREPIRRGGGKPHLIEQVYRRGGEDVYVHRDFPNGISMGEYRRIMAEPENRRSESSWRRMKRNPELYARGTVRHPDHRTITLHDWHRVLMNRENESSTRQFVAFLD